MLFLNFLSQRIQGVIQPGQAHLFDIHGFKNFLGMQKTRIMIVVLVRAYHQVDLIPAKDLFYFLGNVVQPRF
jgi:hypothetical protein